MTALGAAPPTVAHINEAATRYGAEVFEVPTLHCLDVVGPLSVGLIDVVHQHRPAGVATRWYVTHRHRLADLGERIERARKRS